MTLAPASDPDALRRRAAAASLGLAGLLVALKLGAALATGSLAILASLIDSLADVVASGVTFVAVRISQQPPDRAHRFGHGKAESLSALVQAALVAGSAVFVLVDAARRAVGPPEPVVATGLGIAVMAFAIASTLALVLFQRRVVRATGSPAIRADSLHYRADLLTNLSVVASLLVVRGTGSGWVDPLVGTAIALYLGWHAAQIGRGAVSVLMDEELPPEVRASIERTVLAHPEVRGLHDLRTRAAGATRFIELHVELDGGMTVRAAHEVTDAIEGELLEAFPDAEVILHQEPAGLQDARLDHRIAGGAAAVRA